MNKSSKAIVPAKSRKKVSNPDDEILVLTFAESARLGKFEKQIKLYESWRLCVIPVQNRGKVPLVKWQQYQGRKPDETEIKEWLWEFWANGANCGIVCGSISGNLVVLDFDTDESWCKFLKWWKEHRPDDIYAVTPVVKTGRGHQVYLRTTTVINKCQLEGIDIQGERSFVVAPPSIHASGVTYQFVNPDIKQILEINDLSDVGIDSSPPTDSVQPSAAILPQNVSLKIEDIMDGVPQGMRNESCFRMALSYKSRGLSQADALDFLTKVWASKCTPPFPKDEVANCVTSAYRYTNEESLALAQPQVKAIASIVPTAITEGPVQEDELAEGKYQIRTGEELVNSSVPDIKYRISGLLRANGGRLALVGQYKMAKSLLAHDLAFKVAAGEDWLGFKTVESTVLYVNLEISKEKIQERTQEFQGLYHCDAVKLNRFRETTVLDENLALDDGTERIQQILKICEHDGFKVDILILDPRARSIRRSENEEVVIKSFCQNVDQLLKEKPGLSVVIVTHMGKDASKGAIGHSRFSGWLDTEIKLTKGKDLAQRYLTITGRDCESSSITLDFDYPILTIVPEEETKRLDKVGVAKTFILEKLSSMQLPEQQLKAEARQKGISDYAFNAAIHELKAEKKIETIQDKGKGHRKLLRFFDPEEPKA